MKSFIPTFIIAFIVSAVCLGCGQNSSYQGSSTSGASAQSCLDMKRSIRSLKKTAAQAESSASRCEPGSVAQINFQYTAQQARNEAYEFELWVARNCR